MSISDKKLDILIVEDSKHLRFIFSSFLKNTPHSITLCNDGVQAVEKVRSDSFDLILMDIKMPNMDGYTAARMIREHEKSNSQKPTPIVAISAHASEEDIKTSLLAGFTGHVAKPISKMTLHQTINEYL